MSSRCPECGLPDYMTDRCDKQGRLCDFRRGGTRQGGVVHQESSIDFPSRLDIQPGDRFRIGGKLYQFSEQLGRGGFGNVMKLESDDGENRALKLLELWTRDPHEIKDFREKFLAGCRLINFTSPYLVRNFHYGELEGNPFLLMEYCANGSLSSRITEFTKEEVYTDLALQILFGLRELHSRGIIHKDIKSANILFDENDRVRLSDFDLAESIKQGGWLRIFSGFGGNNDWATAVYSAPEQIDNSRMLSPSSDIFSFGITMFEVISGGKFPFGTKEELKDNPNRLYESIRRAEPIRIREHNRQISDDWIDILERCLQYDASRRYQNVKDIISVLERVQSRSTRKVNGVEGWYLEMVYGEGLGEVFVLDRLVGTDYPKVIRLGRASGRANDIPLSNSNKYISEFHCTIERHRDHYYLRDGQWVNNTWVPSTNGTIINGYPIEAKEARLIGENDIIQIGELKLKACYSH